MTSIVYYKPTISRWGQCNVRDRSICISAYVLLLPEWCVEHVVVHELCHLLEPSHNARFHTLMDKFFPRWREARRETHRICRMEKDDGEYQSSDGEYQSSDGESPVPLPF